MRGILGILVGGEKVDVAWHNMSLCFLSFLFKGRGDVFGDLGGLGKN